MDDLGLPRQKARAYCFGWDPIGITVSQVSWLGPFSGGPTVFSALW